MHNPLRTVIRFNEERMKELAQIIAEEAGRRYPAYNRLVEELGIAGDNHLTAREALAELLTFIDFSKSFTRIRNYLKLYGNRREKMYSHGVRQALTRLTMALHGIPRGKQQQELLKTIWLTVRRETHERLAGVPAQQQG